MYLYKYIKSMTIGTPAGSLFPASSRQSERVLPLQIIHQPALLLLLDTSQPSLHSVNNLGSAPRIPRSRRCLSKKTPEQHIRLYAPRHPSNTGMYLHREPRKPKAPSSSVAVSAHICRSPNTQSHLLPQNEQDCMLAYAIKSIG